MANRQSTTTTSTSTSTSTPSRPLARLAGAERASISAGAWVMTAANLVWIAQAGLAAWMIGGLAQGRADLWSLALSVTGFAALGLLRTLAEHWAGGRLFRAAERIKAAQRAALIAREARVNAAAGRQVAAAGLSALATQKIEALGPYAIRYGPARRRAVMVPVVIVLAVLPASWAVAVILLVAGPLIPVFMALIGMAAREASERQMVQIGQLNDALMERLSALNDIRLLDAGPRVADGFEAQAHDLRTRTMAVLRVAFLSSTVLELFAAIGVAMVAVFVGFSLLGEIGFGAWSSGLSPAEGVFVLMLTPEFFQPLRDLAAAWHDKAAAEAVAEELEATRASAPAPIPGTGALASPLGGAPDIAVSRLLLTWPGGAARRVPDFAVKAGQSLAITGPSGVGKSALLAVLAGLEKPGAGAVTVAGRVLDDSTADRWRRSLGWIPQAPHFLNASLRHNITFGGGDPARLSAALREAAFDRVVARLPRGLDTRLGERGAGLSGGEARRATIARALYDAPAVVLADEPTADLDPETAAQVIAGLKALSARGASVIVATHDPELARAMDAQLILGADA